MSTIPMQLNLTEIHLIRKIEFVFGEVSTYFFLSF